MPNGHIIFTRCWQHTPVRFLNNERARVVTTVRDLYPYRYDFLTLFRAAVTRGVTGVRTIGKAGLRHEAIGKAVYRSHWRGLNSTTGGEGTGPLGGN